MLFSSRTTRYFQEDMGSLISEVRYQALELPEPC